jgi:hypothetical protein
MYVVKLYLATQSSREGIKVFSFKIYLFLYGLLKEAITLSDYIASKDKMVSELERIWKEAVVTYFRELCRNLTGGTVENHKKSRL